MSTVKAQTSTRAASCNTTESFTQTVCDSLLSPSGKTWNITGAYLDTILNAASCDSIMFFDLIVINSTTEMFTLSVCDSLISPTGKVWSSTGVYYDTIPNAGGCDSLLTYNLTVGEQFIDTVVVTICDSLISPTGKVWSTTGIYNDTMANVAACDTIMIYNLTIVNPTTSSVAVSVCDSLISPTGKIWNSTGVYLDTILGANSNGCDSIVTFNLTVGQQILDTIVVTACDSLVSPSGKVWSATGIYNDTVVNVAACDTIMTFNLTIVNSTSSSVSVSVCDSLISPTGKVWNTTGVFLDTLLSANSNGCDSVITFNLTVGTQILDTINVFSCDSLVSPSGKVWNTTGIYNDTVVNVAACDSIFVFNLQIGGMLVSLTDTVCDSVVSPSGNFTYDTTGIYQDTVFSALGCDSIVYTYTLQVYNSNNDTIVAFDCDTVFSTSSANMWTVTGIYTDTVFSNQYGCDSTVSYNVTIGNSVTSISPTVCNSYLSPAGNTYTSTGVYYDTLTTGATCDSVFVINLTVNTADTTVNNYQGTLIAFTPAASYKWLNCNSGFAAVAGATGQQFTPTVIGSYALELTKDGCVDTSSCHIVSGLAGIDENSFGANFNVYPNPTSNNFTVSFGETLNNASITLVDVTGKVILTKKVTNVATSLIDINDLDNGTYFIKISNESLVKTISVVKQ